MPLPHAGRNASGEPSFGELRLASQRQCMCAADARDGEADWRTWRSSSSTTTRAMICATAFLPSRKARRICAPGRHRGQNSSDGSVEMVREEFPLGRNDHRLRVQRGYAMRTTSASGNSGFDNDDASEGSSRYVLLLNPDTLLPPNALDDMVAFMDGIPEWASAPELVRADGTPGQGPVVAPFQRRRCLSIGLTGLSRLFPRRPAVRAVQHDLPRRGCRDGGRRRGGGRPWLMALRGPGGGRASG